MIVYSDGNVVFKISENYYHCQARGSGASVAQG